MARWTAQYGKVTLIVNANEIRVNTNSNSSTVNITVNVTGGGFYNLIAQTLTIDINGTQVVNQGGLKYDHRNTNRLTTEYYNGNFTVPHKKDGTGSAVIRVHLTDNYGNNADVATIRQTLPLTTIIQDKPIEVSATQATIGGTVVVKPNLQANEHSSIYLYDGDTYVTAIASKATSDITWTIPDSVGSHFGSSLTKSFDILQYVYVNEVMQRSEKTTIQLDVPARLSLPTISRLKITERNSLVQKYFPDKIIATKSQVHFTANVSTKYGATVDNVALLLDGKTYRATVSNGVASYTVYTITPGTHTAQMTIIDNRGNEVKSEVLSFTVIAYNPPSIEKVSAVRSADDNTKVVINATITGTHIENKNYLKAQLQVLDGSGNWTNVSVAQTSVTGRINYTHTVTDVLASEHYEFRLNVNDRLSYNINTVMRVSTASVLLDSYHSEGLGLGKFYTPGSGFDVMIGEGGMQSDGSITIGKTTITEADLIALKKLI